MLMALVLLAALPRRTQRLSNASSSSSGTSRTTLPLAELRARYEAKLQQAREASKVRDPTVLLLRAQRNTKRRARQCLATRAAVRVLEAKIAELLSEADLARRAVEAAEEAEAEAKLREEPCRAQIAGFSPQLTPEAPGAATPVPDAEETVRGLRTQLESLPAAFRSGNMEAARYHRPARGAGVPHRAGRDVSGPQHADCCAQGSPQRRHAARHAA